ncbi:uncharacterized protein LOC117329131 [Pecten maximus]|uniref:uncharacterized protein LOC117329131 n=1 Tax=Pecten maximus TaxID=6579 RepID=UPI0014590A56|nr:uncharacterized protein LOC117329131 [Pecten maximus]
MASNGSDEEDILSVWESRRRTTIQLLRTLADELDSMQGKVNIGRLTGSTTAIVSGIGTLASLALVPFTGGVSTLAMVGFGGVGVFSGVVSIGTLIGKYFTEKDIMQNVQKAIDDDRETSQRLNEELNVTDENGECVVEANVTPMEVAGALGRVLRAPLTPRRAAVGGCADVGARVGANVVRCAGAAKGAQAVGIGACAAAKASAQAIGMEAAREAGGAIGAGAAIGARAASKVGAAFIVVLLPLDIHDFVVTSIETYHGSIHESANAVRHLADELETEMTSVLAAYRAWRGSRGREMCASLLRSGSVDN